MASRSDMTLSAPIRRLLARFHRDEGGTSMTEFVIVLPVFLTIFVGIVELNKFEVGASRAQIMAAKQVWVENKKIQQQGNFSFDFTHQAPMIAAADAMGKAGGGMAGTFEMLKDARMLSDGAAGEARGATQAGGMVGLPRPSGNPPGDRLSKMPKTLLDESGSQTVASASGPLFPYQAAAMLSRVPLITNAAFAAGARYGMVQGEYKTSVNTPLGSVQVGNRYDVLVAPVPRSGVVGENLTIGFSRLSAQKDRCLSKLMGLNRKMEYMSKCR